MDILLLLLYSAIAGVVVGFIIGMLMRRHSKKKHGKRSVFNIPKKKITKDYISEREDKYGEKNL